MNGTATIKKSFHVQRRGKGRKQMMVGKRSPPSQDMVLRISRLMALAIRFDGLISDGVALDFAELARLGHLTRARLTQIMNLLNLAPDIQEYILFLSRSKHGRDSITERSLRPVVATLDWNRQRQIMSNIAGQKYAEYLKSLHCFKEDTL